MFPLCPWGLTPFALIHSADSIPFSHRFPPANALQSHLPKKSKLKAPTHGVRVQAEAWKKRWHNWRPGYYSFVLCTNEEIAQSTVIRIKMLADIKGACHWYQKAALWASTKTLENYIELWNHICRAWPPTLMLDVKSPCYFKAGSYFLITCPVCYIASFPSLPYQKLLTPSQNSMRFTSFQFRSCLISLTVTSGYFWSGQLAYEIMPSIWGTFSLTVYF